MDENLLEAKRFMLDLFNNGLIGTKEFRNWLAGVDANFKAIRDGSVDDEIDRAAREIRDIRTGDAGSHEELHTWDDDGGR